MGTVLLASGANGRRYALPNATIHMHPAGGGMQGYAPDVEIAAKELLRTQSLLHRLLAQHTGQPLERIQKDFDRDFFMDPSTAKEYGIVDEVLLPPTLKAEEGTAADSEEPKNAQH